MGFDEKSYRLRSIRVNKEIKSYTMLNVPSEALSEVANTFDAAKREERRWI